MRRTGTRRRRVRETPPATVTLARVYFGLHALGLLVVVALVAGLLGLFRLVEDVPLDERSAANVRGFQLIGFWFVVVHAATACAYVVAALPGRSTASWGYRLLLLVAAPVSAILAAGGIGLLVSAACAWPLLCFWFTRDVRGWHGVGRARTGLRSVLARRVLRGD